MIQGPLSPSRIGVSRFDVFLTADRKRSRSEILDVRVGPEARVVCEIPPGVIRVFVNHDVVAVPVPVRDDVIVVGSDVPIEVVEPKALPVSACKVEHVLRPEASGEASVRPRLIEVEMRIVGAAVVAYPSITARVDVRDVGVSRLVRGDVVFLGSCLLSGCRPWCGRRP